MKPVELVNWELEYSVGVNEIDIQHKELMYLVNDMISHSSDSNAKRKVYFQKIIDTVYNHLSQHFDTEERVLGRTDYNKITDHKKEHETISQKVKAIRKELGTNNEDMALYNLTITLKEYFLSHILLYDKDAKEYFRSGNDLAVSSQFHAGIV